MYRLIVVTNIGNYAVEVTIENPNHTVDELIAHLYQLKKELETGCFMEGWTPSDSQNDPPGVFCLGDDVEILAYHAERILPFEVPKFAAEDKVQVLPLVLKGPYLGEILIAKCVTKVIKDVHAIFCYEVNGETPTDVLRMVKLSEVLNNHIALTHCMPGEYLLQIAEDGKIRNFSQASEVLDTLEENFKALQQKKTGKAWNGWKGDDE